MTITDNYSISGLFINKDILINIDTTKCYLHLPSVRELHTNWKVAQGLYFMKTDLNTFQEMLGIKTQSIWEGIKLIYFDLFIYKEAKQIYDVLETTFNFLFKGQFKEDREQRIFKINDITLTEEIWDYIIYILKLNSGEKVEKPRTFNSEEEKQFYLAQKANEERIKKIRGQQEGDPEGLAKILLSINYAFPGLTIDYLLDQTMAQIQWLQKYAAGSVSYEVNAKAFAAGNMKKGSKLDFFIK